MSGSTNPIGPGTRDLVAGGGANLGQFDTASTDVTYTSTFTGDTTKTSSDYAGSATGDFGSYGGDTGADQVNAAVDAQTSDTGGSGGTGVLEYGNWTPAFFMPSRRSIGGIVAQVTIDEQASDDLQITEHPVEQGAPIADHAFKRPAMVTIRAAWSRQYAWDLSAESGVYGLLLSWQAALLPFDVYTGKRKYTNMLIERLQVTTDQHSEYALMATIACRQVIIVSTSSTTAPMSADSDNSKENPEETGNESDGGEKQPTKTGTVPDPETAGPTSPGVFGQAGNPDPETAFVSSPGTFGQPGNPDPEAAFVQNTMNNNGADPPNSPAVPAAPAPNSPGGVSNITIPGFGG